MRRALLCGLLLVAALPAASAWAHHVAADPRVAARLAEWTGSQSWPVIVDWRVNCTGAGDSPYYFGDLRLVDADTGEEIYMGGISGPEGSDRQLVGRRTLPRRVYPRLRASCSQSSGLLHGSGLHTVNGDPVTIPALGDENGDGVRDGSGRGSPGPEDDPLRSGGCARAREGTSGNDVLNGTGGPDLIFGRAGNDRLFGHGGDDCLVGGRGRDRLYGRGGYDRLTAGSGADTLVGGSGVNRYDAGSGNDYVQSANGRRETVRCGSGRDRARADRRDRLRSCERVRRVP